MLRAVIRLSFGGERFDSSLTAATSKHPEIPKILTLRPMLQMAQQMFNGLLDGSLAKIFSFLPLGVAAYPAWPGLPKELSPAAMKVRIAEGIKHGRREAHHKTLPVA